MVRDELIIDYSQTIDNVYENLEDCNATKKRRVLIVFNDKIVDMESKKRLNLLLTELFLRGRKLNILLALISQPCFKVPKTLAMHYFTMKITNKSKLKQIA